MFKLLIDRVLQDGRFVVVNCSNIDVPRGTTLVFLQSRLAVRDGDHFESKALGFPDTVELEVSEIEWFRRSTDVIPRGHNAAVRLKGMGAELVLHHLTKRQKSVQVFLVSSLD